MRFTRSHIGGCALFASRMACPGLGAVPSQRVDEPARVRRADREVTIDGREHGPALALEPPRTAFTKPAALACPITLAAPTVSAMAACSATSPDSS